MGKLDAKKIRVGAGGWLDYTDEPRAESRLRAYSREFNFVEVNSTFYEIMRPQTVERWRKSVPDDFEFSVKCYQALTHKVGLRPVEDAFKVFILMQHYAEILRSNVLVMQTPPSLKLDDKFVRDATDFFKSIAMGNLRIAFEFRVMPEKMPANVLSMLRDLNMVHTVDLTFEDPRFENDLLYSRVFGIPEKNNVLDTNDLNQIRNKVEKSRSEDIRIVGHSLKMIEDSRRIKRLFA